MGYSYISSVREESWWELVSVGCFSGLFPTVKTTVKTDPNSWKLPNSHNLTRKQFGQKWSFGHLLLNIIGVGLNYSEIFTDHDPNPWVGSGRVRNLTGRVGSGSAGSEGLDVTRVGPGPRYPTRPDPRSSTRADPTREQP